ncbi:MAG: hypothetical protein MMC23_004498 [Stictis urceolatum]|nr:hypothetical protein [Stictis urceolata]
MASKTIVFITGANTGLGYEVVKALYASSKPYEIIVGARSSEKSSAAIEKLKSEVPSSSSTLSSATVDVASDSSIEAVGKDLSSRHDRLDVLINNAGASFDGAIAAGKLSVREAWNAGWDTNVTGTHILTNTLAPLLLKSSEPRLLFITSGTSNLKSTEDTTFRLSMAPEKGWPKPMAFPIASYRSAKTGMNMMAREWERCLRNDGVKVHIISPGMLATGLANGDAATMRKMGAEEPNVGGEFIRDVVQGARDDDKGLIVMRGGVQPW